jgi:hypothetical protein
MIKEFLNWIFSRNKKVVVEAKVDATSPWPFPVVTGTPTVIKKKPTVKKATTRRPIDKDSAIKSMKKPAAKKAATKKKKASK